MKKTTIIRLTDWKGEKPTFNTADEPTSWACYMLTSDGAFTTNACRYATKEEASHAGLELMTRWTAPTGYEARPSSDPVNYEFRDGRPRRLNDDD